MRWSLTLLHTSTSRVRSPTPFDYPTTIPSHSFPISLLCCLFISIANLYINQDLHERVQLDHTCIWIESNTTLDFYLPNNVGSGVLVLILHSVELIGLMKISSTEWLFVNAWNGLKDQRTNHALTGQGWA